MTTNATADDTDLRVVMRNEATGEQTTWTLTPGPCRKPGTTLFVATREADITPAGAR